MWRVTNPGQARPVAAVRAARPGWRDPRLWVGITLVAVSIVAGARLLDRADKSIAVYVSRGELAAGAALTTDALEPRRVRFVEPADAARYLIVGDEFPEGVRLTRGVGTGELVPRSALETAADSSLLTVPLALPALAVPPDVSAGARVDVWVTAEDSRGARSARPFLTDVTVISTPVGEEAFGASGDRQLILGVEREQSRELGRTLAAIGESSITIVGRGEPPR
jgi:hypothetical protein